MISYFDNHKGRAILPFPRSLPGYGQAIRKALEFRFESVAGCPFSAAKFMDGFRIGKAFGDSQVLESMRFEHDEKQAFMPGSLFG